MLAGSEPMASPERGDLLEGMVLSINQGGVIVDLGLKRDGVIPRTDLDKLPADEGRLEVGQEIAVMVIDPLDSDGNLIVSIAQARESGDWLRARQILETNEIIEAEVSGSNRGGLLIPFGRLMGFCPASHISDLPRGADENERQQLMQGMAGRKLPFKIIEVDPQRRRLVFSERKAIRQWRQEHKAEVIATLKEGEVRRGVVTSLREFGAFVDIGGADGLIHISEMAWTRVDDPGKILKVGDEVEVLVYRLDRKSNRIGLSLKRLQPNPWKEAAEAIHEGDTLQGEIACVTQGGIFIRVADRLEGLLRGYEGLDAISAGEPVTVCVTAFDPEKEHLDLELVKE